MSLNRKEADGSTTQVAGIPFVTKENIGLGKVENKSPEELVAMSMEAMNYVTPEMFDAVGDGIADDTEAFQAMFDTVNESGGNIVLSHTYRLNSRVLIGVNTEKVETKIKVYGIGKTAKILIGRRGGFKGRNEVYSNGGVTFIGVNFEGADDSELNECLLQNTKKLIRLDFIACVFRNISSVANQFIEEASEPAEDQYIQSYTFTSCWFRTVNTVIQYDRFYNISFNQCTVENHSRLIVSGKSNEGSGLTITNCCIEGSTDYSAIAISNVSGINVSGNYFEANQIDVELLESDVENVVSGVVIGNTSYSCKRGFVSLVADGEHTAMELTIMNNNITRTQRAYIITNENRAITKNQTRKLVVTNNTYDVDMLEKYKSVIKPEFLSQYKNDRAIIDVAYGDWNNYIYPKTYIYGGFEVEHAPTRDIGILEVNTDSENYISQVLTTETDGIYIRFSRNMGESFGEWEHIKTDKEPSIISGDLNNYLVSGAYIYSGTTVANAPSTTEPGVLKVDGKPDLYVTQLLITRNDGIYYRMTVNGGKSFTNWNHIVPTEQ